MSMVKVYAPNEAYAGTVGDIRFEGGVAEVSRTHPSMSYFERKGYGIGKPVKAEDALPADKREPTVDGEPIDARDYAESVLVGSPLRDAAVDPEPSDFLPPTNAGKANPHGPKVVAPGIHGVGPAPIRPGETFVDDTKRQEREETRLAEAVLVDGDLATSVGAEFDADKNMGPLGLSDPGSVSMGVEAAKDVAASEREASKLAPAAGEEGGPPDKSALKEDWVAYAVSQGLAEDEAKALKKDVLVKRFGD
jgi:hypothetical protein